MDADSDEDDGLEPLRQKIADAHGFDLYLRYTETQAAEFIGVHPATLKRARLDGEIGFVRVRKRTISYFGFHIANYLIGSMEWGGARQKPATPNRFSSSATAGSGRNPAAKPGTATGTIPTDSKLF